eukprot:2882615-Pleurochrysis_carterae.AAC.1
MEVVVEVLVVATRILWRIAWQERGGLWRSIKAGLEAAAPSKDAEMAVEVQVEREAALVTAAAAAAASAGVAVLSAPLEQVSVTAEDRMSFAHRVRWRRKAASKQLKVVRFIRANARETRRCRRQR